MQPEINADAASPLISKKLVDSGAIYHLAAKYVTNVSSIAHKSKNFPLFPMRKGESYQIANEMILRYLQRFRLRNSSDTFRSESNLTFTHPTLPIQKLKLPNSQNPIHDFVKSMKNSPRMKFHDTQVIQSLMTRVPGMLDKDTKVHFLRILEKAGDSEINEKMISDIESERGNEIELKENYFSEPPKNTRNNDFKIIKNRSPQKNRARLDKLNNVPRKVAEENISPPSPLRSRDVNVEISNSNTSRRNTQQNNNNINNVNNSTINNSGKKSANVNSNSFQSSPSEQDTFVLHLGDSTESSQDKKSQKSDKDSGFHLTLQPLNNAFASAAATKKKEADSLAKVNKSNRKNKNNSNHKNSESNAIIAQITPGDDNFTYTFSYIDDDSGYYSESSDYDSDPPTNKNDKRTITKNDKVSMKNFKTSTKPSTFTYTYEIPKKEVDDSDESLQYSESDDEKSKVPSKNASKISSSKNITKTQTKSDSKTKTTPQKPKTNPTEEVKKPSPAEKQKIIDGNLAKVLNLRNNMKKKPTRIISPTEQPEVSPRIYTLSLPQENPKDSRKESSKTTPEKSSSQKSTPPKHTPPKQSTNTSSKSNKIKSSSKTNDNTAEILIEKINQLEAELETLKSDSSDSYSDYYSDSDDVKIIQLRRKLGNVISDSKSNLSSANDDSMMSNSSVRSDRSHGKHSPKISFGEKLLEQKKIAKPIKHHKRSRKSSQNTIETEKEKMQSPSKLSDRRKSLYIETVEHVSEKIKEVKPTPSNTKITMTRVDEKTESVERKPTISATTGKTTPKRNEIKPIQASTSSKSSTEKTQQSQIQNSGSKKKTIKKIEVPIQVDSRTTPIKTAIGQNLQRSKSPLKKNVQEETFRLSFPQKEEKVTTESKHQKSSSKQQHTEKQTLPQQPKQQQQVKTAPNQKIEKNTPPQHQSQQSSQQTKSNNTLQNQDSKQQSKSKVDISNTKGNSKQRMKPPTLSPSDDDLISDSPPPAMKQLLESKKKKLIITSTKKEMHLSPISASSSSSSFSDDFKELEQKQKKITAAEPPKKLSSNVKEAANTKKVVDTKPVVNKEKVIDTKSKDLPLDKKKETLLRNSQNSSSISISKQTYNKKEEPSKRADSVSKASTSSNVSTSSSKRTAETRQSLHAKPTSQTSNSKQSTQSNNLNNSSVYKPKINVKAVREQSQSVHPISKDDRDGNSSSSSMQSDSFRVPLQKTRNLRSRAMSDLSDSSSSISERRKVPPLKVVIPFHDGHADAFKRHYDMLSSSENFMDSESDPIKQKIKQQLLKRSSSVIPESKNRSSNKNITTTSRRETRNNSVIASTSKNTTIKKTEDSSSSHNKIEQKSISNKKETSNIGAMSPAKAKMMIDKDRSQSISATDIDSDVSRPRRAAGQHHRNNAARRAANYVMDPACDTTVKPKGRASSVNPKITTSSTSTSTKTSSTANRSNNYNSSSTNQKEVVKKNKDVFDARVTVVESEKLAKVDTFIVLYIEGGSKAKRTKTVLGRTASKFFRETFTFEITDDKSYLVVQAKKEDLINGDTPIASTKFSLMSLPLNQKQEKWVSLAPSGRIKLIMERLPQNKSTTSTLSSTLTSTSTLRTQSKPQAALEAVSGSNKNKSQKEEGVVFSLASVLENDKNKSSSVSKRTNNVSSNSKQIQPSKSAVFDNPDLKVLLKLSDERRDADPLIKSLVRSMSSAANFDDDDDSIVNVPLLSESSSDSEESDDRKRKSHRSSSRSKKH
ncbi:hypothetical protein TRFO_12218 [Tritrichomonas foetus]|uniref:C2 domain-containing protein n=1 Tax=Tritrichomonas foetus TaxID=1144522 RepID=A0A1J4J0A4_9EUKA|nr:hypothetical protein TRFO_12218 [Tritrichomonas foetus]|eukprot:OHS92858.1 hypothetical protein TRFO_12218 [Tritrichomonas foetus]